METKPQVYTIIIMVLSVLAPILLVVRGADDGWFLSSEEEEDSAKNIQDPKEVFEVS